MSTISDFSKAARDLSKNPLGIIALFIERYSKPHEIEKKNSPRAASNASS